MKSNPHNFRDGDFNRGIAWMNGVTSMEGAWYTVNLAIDEEKIEAFNEKRMDMLDKLAGGEFFSKEVIQIIFIQYLYSC